MGSIHIADNSLTLSVYDIIYIWNKFHESKQGTNSITGVS